MNKIIYLPLEHIEGRYTTHLDRDITDYLKDKNYVKIYPQVLSGNIKNGSFLDAPTTINFKSLQLAQLAELYYRDEIFDDDIIFCSDLWFPGIESVAYLNYFTKKNVKLRGIIHAGSFTDTDFVRDMERWAKYFEDIIFDISEKVFVASNFIKQDLIKKRLINPNKIIITPFPLDYSNIRHFISEKKDKIVIFNGRNVDEKQPHLFKELEKLINDSSVSFINTQLLNLSKQDYYKLIGRSKVVVSFALQENYGFGINESVFAGCIPIVPNRLAYVEQYDKQYRYDNFIECVDMVKNALDDKLNIPLLSNNKEEIKKWFEI